MASLSLSNAELKRNWSMIAGVSRDSTQWDAQTTDDFENCVRNGRRRFYAAHDWSFLTHSVTFPVIAPYETGTITVVNGTVTLAGGTWPSNAAGQRIAFGDAVYEIATRTSDTVIVLHDTSVDASALTTFKLYSTRYDLPASFASFVGPVTLEAVRDESCIVAQETAILPEFELRRLLSRATAFETAGSGRGPVLFAVTRTIASTEIGLPSYKLELYPLPDQAYTLRAMIRISPGDSLSEADATELVDASFSDLMRLAILSATEYLYNGKAGINSQTFMQELPNYIRRDKQQAGARRLLPRRDGHSSQYDSLYQLRVAPVIIE